jgi:hypothetical protein
MMWSALRTNCSLEHAMNHLLAFEIDLARGLVENQNCRIAQDGPSQRDALALAAGKFAAALADHGLVTVLEFLFDEAMGMRLLRRGDHLFARGVRRAVLDVVEDRVVEEERSDDADWRSRSRRRRSTLPSSTRPDGIGELQSDSPACSAAPFGPTTHGLLA